MFSVLGRAMSRLGRSKDFHKSRFKKGRSASATNRKRLQAHYNPRTWRTVSTVEHPVVKHQCSFNNSLGAGYNSNIYVSWSLSAITEDTSYKQLYSLYRINKIVLTVFLDQQDANLVGIIAGAPPIQPYVMSSIDDSGGPLSTTPTLQQISEYTTFKLTGSSEGPHVRVIYPKYIVDGQQPSNDWTSTQDDTQLWYGLLLAFVNTNTSGSPLSYTVKTDYYMTFKSQH